MKNKYRKTKLQKCLATSIFIFHYSLFNYQIRKNKSENNKLLNESSAKVSKSAKV